LRRYPDLYQVNTRTFLTRLSEKYNRPLTLSSVPDEEWKSFADLGFDFVWLMGVWQRSPTARRMAIQSPGLRQEYDRLLPGWMENDVPGSPYAIYDYRLDPSLGNEDELLDAKKKINRLGMGLILDFVANHLAIDHPWTIANPERFVRGEPADVRKHPDWFFPAEISSFLAHGRDPYFAPWNDTAQVNFFSTSLRQAFYTELERISTICDGLRCDMAMLALNSVFKQVWGDLLDSIDPPATEFWDEAIARLRKLRPDFLLLAEVYWGLDRQLQKMGFDYTYDKPFYDHLLHDNAGEIEKHIINEGEYIGHQAHFIENHDEARSISTMGKEKSLAAATIVATIPGLRFYQRGQLEGRKIRIPVQLGREPVEPADQDVFNFYRKLLLATGAVIFHEGRWVLVEKHPAWEGNNSYQNILAWQWEYEQHRDLIVINYSAFHSQAWIKLSPEYGGLKEIVFRDIINNIEYVRDVSALNGKGLYVDLQPFQAHFLDVEIG
jgi:hypothetical protein